MPLLIGIAIIIVIIIWMTSLYINLVRLRNRRQNAFADIDVQLRQRHDLVPQLVETVKGYSTHEKEVLYRVTEARAAAMNATSINDKIQTEQQLTTALQGLKVSLEAYPDLKANQNFLDLQAQLEGTENRIAVARNRFNEVVRPYNVYIKRFPNNMLAGMYGFQPKGYFEASKGAENAPTVDFGK